MKSVILVIVCVLGVLNSNAQEKISYSKVIKVDSVSADGIFISIKNWLSMEFKKGNNAIELEDKDAGLIIANANSGYECSKRGIAYIWADGSIEFKIKIQIKNERFKITLTNFILKCPNGGGEKMGILTTAEESNYTAWGKKQYNEVWKDLKEKTIEISNDWFKIFEKIDFSNYKKDTSDDW